MRAIRFRAWERNLKEMIPVYDIDFKTEIINVKSAWRFFNEIELMEFTGLVDKNGKEIYAGDVVSALDDATEDPNWGLDRQRVGTIEYIDNLFALKCNDIYLSNWINAENIEVIGNIYENPELLGTRYE